MESKPIKEEDLAPYQPLFDDAIDKLVFKKKAKYDTIIELANTLKEKGFPEKRICWVIIKKVAIPDPVTKRRYADDDYIRKIMPGNFKDYVHGKKTPKPKPKVITEKEKKTSEQLSEERKKSIDKSLKEEIAKESKIYEEKTGKPSPMTAGLPTPTITEPAELEIDVDPDAEEDYSDNVVEVDSLEKAAKVIARVDSKKVQELEKELADGKIMYAEVVKEVGRLKQESAKGYSLLKEAQKAYNELLTKHNWLAKPYLEKRWTIVPTKLPDGTTITTVVEYDAVAIPVEKRINIPRTLKNKSFSRQIPFDEMEIREKEWEKKTRGKKYILIKIKKPTPPGPVQP